VAVKQEEKEEKQKQRGSKQRRGWQWLETTGTESPASGLQFIAEVIERERKGKVKS